VKRCLETRATAEGFKRRRYEDEGGARRTTIEIPLELWRGAHAKLVYRDRRIETLQGLLKRAHKALK